MRGLPRRLAACLCLAALCGGTPSLAMAKEMVFLDNDFSGPGETNIQALYPVLADPDAELIGVGAVTGDAWRDEGAAHLFAFLDRTGCGKLPVHAGAEMPLLRNRAEMTAWESRYGKLLWKGAWQPASPHHPEQHPDRPDFVAPLPEGAPHSTFQAPSAAEAMVAAVRRYPHQVTIVAAGPMTDLALAIRLDPDFPKLAKQLVFMGGLVDTDLTQIAMESRKAPDFYTDFNMLFDPEAAHIVLTAPWAQIVNAGAVTETIPLTTALVDTAGKDSTPQAAYFKRYAKADIPMWDELAMALALHPDLVKSAVTATLDVDTGGGLAYGRTHARALSLAPPGAPPTQIVTEIDADGFYKLFAQSLGAPLQCPK